MKYITLNFDVEGLLNNRLYVYKVQHNYSKDAGHTTELVPIDIGGADFVIADRQLSTSEVLTHEKTLADSNNVTPKQLHNILFFEMLKAFRR